MKSLIAGLLVMASVVAPVEIAPKDMKVENSVPWATFAEMVPDVIDHSEGVCEGSAEKVLVLTMKHKTAGIWILQYVGNQLIFVSWAKDPPEGAPDYVYVGTVTDQVKIPPVEKMTYKEAMERFPGGPCEYLVGEKS